MLYRLVRTAGAFATIWLLYQIYARAVVPGIELESVHVAAVDPLSTPIVEREQVRVQREQLSRWFKPGDWELTSSKMLETAQGIFLVDQYSVQADGRVRLTPCTMVFLPELKPGDDVEERYRRAVVVRSSPERGYAVLHFDTPFDFTQGKVGKLVGGQIVGNVTIFSQQRSLGPEDDLLIHCRDIDLRENRITSPHTINFAWGPHRGQGQKLKIELAPERRNEGLMGMTSLELGHSVFLHFEAAHTELFPLGDPPQGTNTVVAIPPATTPLDGPSLTPDDDPPTPLEIKSQGPFRFDIIAQTATFQDAVDVTRLNPEGPSDTLTCQQLILYLHDPTEKELSSTSASSKGSPMRLQPLKLSATGHPATLRIPANDVEARAGQIEYDVPTGLATLRDLNEAVVRQGSREIHSRELFLQPDESRRLGRFLAKGRGWLKGVMPDDPQQQFEASWSRALHFRPHEGQHVLSVEGDAHVYAVDRGSVDAEEIHLWLWDVPNGAAPTTSGGQRSVDLRPDRLKAIGRVRIDSPQVAGAVGELMAWFEYPPPALGLIQLPASILAQRLPPVETVPRPVGQTLVPVNPEVVSALPRVPNQGRIHVVGELLKVRARPVGTQMQVVELIVEHDVRVEEAPTGELNERPLKITGQKLHVAQPTPTDQVLSISGKPAQIEGRGLTLISETVHLNRTSGAIWTDGAGTMTLLVDRDANGKLLARPEPLEVVWQGMFQFAGRLARFERNVVARQIPQTLKTQRLEVTLTTPLIAEGGQKNAQRPDVEQVACYEGVELERVVWEAQQMAAVERLQAVDLTVARSSGNMLAHGPGWVRTTRRQRPGQQTPGIPTLPGGPAPAASDERETIQYLGVDFQGTLTGNMSRHELVFDNTVRAIHGPVPNWEQRLDPDRPRLGGSALLLTTDRLSVVQAPGATPETNAVEMEATGNTLVEGETYTARASRLAYTQAKGLLVLEGNGRSDARLYHQPRVGAATSEVAAGKILYWVQSGRVEVDKATFLDLQNLK